MAVKVQEEQRGEWAVLRVIGELDMATSSTLRHHVHEAVAQGRRRLVLDLSEVLFCDTSGVGVLIAARRLLRSCAGRLRLILPARGAEDGSHVNRVLAALGVRRLFDCYPDLASAATTAVDGEPGEQAKPARSAEPTKPSKPTKPARTPKPAKPGEVPLGPPGHSGYSSPAR